MMTFVTTVHCITIVFLVIAVLVQSGKGAEISASFGGSSQTVFGSSGGANFFTRFTAGAATVFFITSITLTLLGSQSKKSVFEGVNVNTTAPVSAPASAPAEAAKTTPAKPAPAKQ